MSFQELAHATDEVATGLTQFVSQVPEHAADITSAVSELFAISTALRSLESSHSVPALRPNFNRIIDDVELIVRGSLRHTLRDILSSLQQMNGGRRIVPDQAAAYRATWVTLWSFFYHQAGYSLVLRLKYYRSMLEEMAAIVRGEAADEFVLAHHRKAITPLRLAQDRRFAEIASQRRYSTAPPPQPAPAPPPYPAPFPPEQTVLPHRRDIPLKSALRKPRPSVSAPPDLLEEMRSFERERPPQSPYESRSRPASPDSSLDTFGSLPSGTTDSSESSETVDELDHWALKVFDPPPISTALARPGPPTRCYGQHMPGAKSRLYREYDKLFQLDFPGDPPMSVSFHLRESDHRTRVLCSVHVSPNRTKYCTLPITSLTIAREGSSLQLYQKITHRKDMELWADLRFKSIERLVAFHNTFLALRGQDASHPVGNIKDAELDGEIQIYGGQIIDDDFLHALRIYRDTDSKAVRLVAQVHEGELTRVPVWNAFIHRQMRSPSWMRRMGPTTLYLWKLQRTIYIDPSEYRPQVTPDGYHVITFASERDLDAFIWSVNDYLKRTRTY
ncbi:hypothetical protein VTO42DRAFT_5311 [Malbranchea cinnamomea]